MFPTRAGDAKEPFQHRKDKGISRSIPEPAQEFVLSRWSRGSKPGEDGHRPTSALVHYDYQCFRGWLLEAHKVEGTEHPDKLGFPEISSIAVWRFLDRFKSDPATIYARQGSKAFQELVAPHILRTKTNLFAFDWFTGDHRQSNVWVRWSFDPRIIYRPWITMWYDVRTNYPLAFVLSPRPSSLTIMRSLLIALETYRVKPLVIYVDNGKDYRAQVLTSGAPSPFALEGRDGFDERQRGLIERLGIEYRNALPSRRSKSTGEQESHACSKPIEGFFGRWLDDFDAQQPGACGRNPDERPDKNSAELLLFDEYLPFDYEYEAQLASYISHRVIHHRSRGEGMGGLSPAKALEEFSRSKWGLEERRITPEELAYYKLAGPEPRRVRSSMINVKIGGETHYYQHWALFYLNGQDVQVKYNPADADEVFVYDGKRALGLARRVRRLPWGEEPEAIAEGMRQQRLARRAAKSELARRRQAPVPTQAEQHAIRRLLGRQNLLPGEVPHAASLERGPAGARQTPDHPEMSSTEWTGRKMGLKRQKVKFPNERAAAVLRTLEEEAS